MFNFFLTICIATTPSQNQVHTVGIVENVSDAANAVFQFKENYED